MTVLEALSILEAATLDCKTKDIDTPEVHEALTLLEPDVQSEWLIQQFRHHVFNRQGATATTSIGKASNKYFARPSPESATGSNG